MYLNQYILKSNIEIYTNIFLLSDGPMHFSVAIIVANYLCSKQTNALGKCRYHHLSVSYFENYIPSKYINTIQFLISIALQKNSTHNGLMSVDIPAAKTEDSQANLLGFDEFETQLRLKGVMPLLFRYVDRSENSSFNTYINEDSKGK